MHRTLVLAACAFLAALGYALVRYVVLKGTPAAHIPAFVTNKAVAVTSAVLLGASLVARTAECRRSAGLMGLAAAGLHVLLSLAVLSPSYFPGYYSSIPDGGFDLLAEAALLTGSLALVLLLVLSWPRSPRGPRWSERALALLSGAILVLTGGHAALLGWQEWWRPDEWPGSLPPMSLLAFVVALASLALAVARHAAWRELS